MRRYIGLDVHKASTTFGVINESGKRVGVHVVETNGEALVAQLKAIPGERHVCLEEGTQSAWLYEILSPHAKQVVVEAVSESRGQKDDERDALGLAERTAHGSDQADCVQRTSSAYRQLRELGRTHTMVVRDVVRVQNRIKALFRSRGVSVSGKGIYSEEGRKAPLERLPEASRGAAETLFAEYDAVAKVRRHAEKDLVAEAHRHDVSRLLETCPGLGPIRVAQLIPIVVSPGRFRTKRQFWSYCGLGIVMRSSSDWVKNETGDWQRAEGAEDTWPEPHAQLDAEEHLQGCGEDGRGEHARRDGAPASGLPATAGSGHEAKLGTTDHCSQGRCDRSFDVEERRRGTTRRSIESKE